MPAASHPMLTEFELINTAKTETLEDLQDLAAKICELFTDDVLLEDLSTTDVVRGQKELFDYIIDLFGPYSNLHIEPREIINTDHVSTMLLEISGDHSGHLYGVSATGRRVSFPAVAIYRCNDENTKVRHETLGYDTNFIIQQISN